MLMISCVFFFCLFYIYINLAEEAQTLLKIFYDIPIDYADPYVDEETLCEKDIHYYSVTFKSSRIDITTILTARFNIELSNRVVFTLKGNTHHRIFELFFLC